MGYGVSIDVSGPRACFTRPEMKAERVSYDVITPSAARGILEAVYWKPAIVWRVDSIKVINEIRTDTFRRNEVGSKESYSNAKRVFNASSKDADHKAQPLYLSATTDRQQRATLLLTNVRYVINAHFEMTDKAGSSDTPEKHYNIALRRLRKGQCFNQPYFGCREFPVLSIRVIEDGKVPESFYEGTSVDLGYMLYDIDFAHDMRPMFFRARMNDGVIDVASARGEVIG